MYRWITLLFFSIGFLWIGSMGAGTDMAYVWPGLMVLGLNGCLFVFARTDKCRSPDSFCLVATVLFAAYIALRAYLSPIPYSNRSDLCLLLVCVLVYILFSTFATSLKARTFVVWLLMVIALGNLVVALYQFTQDSSFHIRPGESRDNTRQGYMSSGFYFTHDHMAGFLEIAALFSLSMGFMSETGSKMRVVYLFSGLLSLGGVAISMSRGGYLSTGAGLLMLGVMAYRQAKEGGESRAGIRRLLLVVMILLIGGFAVAGGVSIVKRFSHSSTTKVLDFERDVRLTNWKLAIDQWRLEPVMGTGSRTYDNYSVKLWPKEIPRNSGHPVFTHNDYLQLLAEYGAVGFALGLVFFVVHFVRGIWAVPKRRVPGFFNTLSALRAGALASLVAYSVHSMFDFNLHFVANAIPLAFACAVLSGSLNGRNPSQAREKISVNSLKFVGLVVGIWFLTSGYSIARAEYHRVRMEHFIDEGEHMKAIYHGGISTELDKKNYLSYRFLGFSFLREAEEYDARVLRDSFLRKAQDAFEACVKVNSWDIISYRQIGRCHSKLGEYEAASIAFEKAIELGPLEFEAHLQSAYHFTDWGTDLLRQGELERGIEILKKAMDAYQGAIRADYSRIRPVSVADDNYKAFRDFFSEVYRSQAVLHEDAGDTALANGRKDDALAAFRESLRYANEEIAFVAPMNPHIDTLRRKTRLFKVLGEK
jgi:O-antigen ligase